MNSLPNAGAHLGNIFVGINAGAHLGNIFVGIVKVRTAAFVEPLDHWCHFATGGEEGEEVMTVIIAGIIHLGPVRVETQVIVLEPLCGTIAIFFDLALIHSADRETTEYWIMGITVDGGFKVVEGVVRIITV
jgi:hypothetical protein